MKNRWKVIMALMLISGIAQAAYVTISNAVNVADGLTGFGAVGYEYNIGQYEVTIAEWDVFATATGIGGGNENYWNDGTHGSVGTAAPVTYVTLYEAMQYCNWLTTGSATTGVYSFDGGGNHTATMSRSAILMGGLDAVATDTNKIYALPTEDEWYKAAYYTGSDYSYFADGHPYDQPTIGAGGWNYATSTVWTVGTGGTEQNGTEDMMGNVNEWVEDSAGRVRGQNYSLTSANYGYLRSTLSGGAFPATSQFYNTGFRAVELVPTIRAVYVTIGNAVNADDTLPSGGKFYGGVNYEYNIGQYEVTIAEWGVFAVAEGVGGGNENYWNDGTHGSVGTAAPVTYVTLHEAMQYCNWLTTGSATNGVYSFDGGGNHIATMSRTDIMAGGLDAIATDTNKIYALPTEDEWYKAAYYTGSDYSYFADGHPYDQPTLGVGGWNYANTTVWTVGTGGTEQNGTEDMMGNVNEWVEDSAGRVRGQNYSLSVPNYPYLRSTLSGGSFPATSQFYNTGFRAVELVPGSMPTHIRSIIVSLSHFSGDVYEMVVDCPTPLTSYPKVSADLASGSWGDIGHSTSSAGPFDVNNLGAVSGIITIYVESGANAAFFGIGEE